MDYSKLATPQIVSVTKQNGITAYGMKNGEVLYVFNDLSKMITLKNSK